MRTTVNIQDHLLAKAKQVAAATHRPIGAVIDDALRVLFHGRDSGPSPDRRVSLPTDGASGLRPGVDLDDRDAVAELLGEHDGTAHVAS